MNRLAGRRSGLWAPLAAAVIVFFSATILRAANECIDCHQTRETLTALPSENQEAFLHWYGSIHGEKGVTCDKCHGGNPAEKTKKSAHAQMAKPSDPASKVYYKNLPDTCGACHRDVANAYKESVHYQMLRADRLAPTCTTCHGFYMNIQPVRPTSIIMRCQVCHGSEDKADPRVIKAVEGAFLIREQTQDVLRDAWASVKLLKATNRDAAGVEKRLKQAQKSFDETAVIWHSMKLKRFEGAITGAKEMAESSLKMAQDELMKAGRPENASKPAER